jgi:hypothetical protein
MVLLHTPLPQIVDLVSPGEVGAATTTLPSRIIGGMGSMSSSLALPLWGLFGIGMRGVDRTASSPPVSGSEATSSRSTSHPLAGDMAKVGELEPGPVPPANLLNDSEKLEQAP